MQVTPPDDFYFSDPPTELQQGDILAGAAMLFAPAHRELIVVRSSGRRPFPDGQLRAGPAELVREAALNDAFDDEYEYVTVAATRTHVMLLTPTCDLADPKVHSWLGWPLHPLKDSGVDEGNLVGGRYGNLFRLPDHRNFPASFVDVTDVRTLSSKAIGLKDRVASIARAAQDKLQDKFANAFGKNWGYEPGEEVPKLSKYETGKFRCARCIMLDIAVVEKQFEEGGKFPQCDNCVKVGRAAQWYPVRLHRRY